MWRISFATSCCARRPYRLPELPRRLFCELLARFERLVVLDRPLELLRCLLRELPARADDEADFLRELRDPAERDEDLRAVDLPRDDFAPVRRDDDFRAEAPEDFRAVLRDVDLRPVVRERELAPVDFRAADFRELPVREREEDLAAFLVAMGLASLLFRRAHDHNGLRSKIERLHRKPSCIIERNRLQP